MKPKSKQPVNKTHFLGEGDQDFKRQGREGGEEKKKGTKGEE